MTDPVKVTVKGSEITINNGKNTYGYTMNKDGTFSSNSYDFQPGTEYNSKDGAASFGPKDLTPKEFLKEVMALAPEARNSVVEAITAANPKSKIVENLQAASKEIEKELIGNLCGEFKSVIPPILTGNEPVNLKNIAPFSLSVSVPKNFR